MEKLHLHLHPLTGVNRQNQIDNRRKIYTRMADDSRAKGMPTSFFKNYLIVETSPVSLTVIDVMSGRTSQFGSIGAVQGYIQGRLFRMGYLV